MPVGHYESLLHNKQLRDFSAAAGSRTAFCTCKSQNYKSEHSKMERQKVRNFFRPESSRKIILVAVLVLFVQMSAVRCQIYEQGPIALNFFFRYL